MIDGSFGFVAGLGPARARELAALGIRTWDAFPASGLVLSPKLDERIRDGIGWAKPLLSAANYVDLAKRIPSREHWRFYPHLEREACFLDIETSIDGRVTVVGLFDVERGPRLYVRGHNLGDFVRDPIGGLVVTFNGASFDLPVLRKAFPGWEPPPLHLDLRTPLRHLGERGGLKAIEIRLGLARPVHMQGIGGADALSLWARFRRGDVPALRALCEYNLYDVVQLKSLAEIATERLSRAAGRPWAPRGRFVRGDVLVDMTKAVEGVVARAGSIEPDMFHDEERRAFRRQGV